MAQTVMLSGVVWGSPAVLALFVPIVIATIVH